MRLLVAETQPILRAGVVDLLEGRRGTTLAIAGSAPELLDCLERSRFDVLLLDWALGEDAIGAARRATHAALVIWAERPTSEILLRAIACGARGLLPKSISREGLVRALEGALRGEAPLTRDLAGLMVQTLQQLDGRNTALERARALSDRECEVLHLVAEGRTNREIGAALAISEFTVKRHMQNILRKLELQSRRDAATLYRAAYPRGAAVAGTVA